MSDYRELKRLSETATPGPWVKTVDGVMPEGEKFGIFGNFGANNGEANREFIASANPATVLALISEVEELRKDAERYRWLFRQRSQVWRDIAEMPSNHTNEHIDLLMSKGYRP